MVHSRGKSVRPTWCDRLNLLTASQSLFSLSRCSHAALKDILGYFRSEWPSSQPAIGSTAAGSRSMGTIDTLAALRDLTSDSGSDLEPPLSRISWSWNSSTFIWDQMRRINSLWLQQRGATLQLQILTQLYLSALLKSYSTIIPTTNTQVKCCLF